MLGAALIREQSDCSLVCIYALDRNSAGSQMELICHRLVHSAYPPFLCLLSNVHAQLCMAVTVTFVVAVPIKLHRCCAKRLFLSSVGSPV